jgi:HD-GYP domain-containing protein (c-di-GMP phosphodiesterase class II)
MTSPRPYAARLTVPEAVAELQRCAGTQFDPAIIDAVCELVAEPAWPHDPASALAGDIARSHSG